MNYTRPNYGAMLAQASQQFGAKEEDPRSASVNGAWQPVGEDSSASASQMVGDRLAGLSQAPEGARPMLPTQGFNPTQMLEGMSPEDREDVGRLTALALQRMYGGQ